MDFQGFHRHVKNKYILVWEKEKVHERSGNEKKERVFMDKNFKTLQNTSIRGVPKNTPRHFGMFYDHRKTLLQKLTSIVMNTS